MGLIYCRECSAQISDLASTCPHCGAPVQIPAAGNTQQTVNNNNSNVCPETHLTKAILLTIFCCWPMGIPAIVNASAVSNAFIAGNYELALEKSKNAEKWCKYCIIAGAVFYFVYIVIMVIAFAVSA